MRKGSAIALSDANHDDWTEIKHHHIMASRFLPQTLAQRCEEGRVCKHANPKFASIPWPKVACKHELVSSIRYVASPRFCAALLQGLLLGRS